jgi:hypothetical protein
MHKIRLGLVGLGIMGRRYYAMLRALAGVEVTALCVRHLDTIDDLPGAKFSFPLIFIGHPAMCSQIFIQKRAIRIKISWPFGSGISQVIMEGIKIIAKVRTKVNNAQSANKRDSMFLIIVNFSKTK